MNECESELRFAQRILTREALAVTALADALSDGADLGEPFVQAVDLLQSCADSGGSVVVTGLGKSGLVGQKISATLASLGIPSHAVHPTEAAHGDLGRFRPTDTVICLSCSGRTQEVVNLAAILRQDHLPIIALTGRPADKDDATSLEQLASVTLCLNLDEEAGAPDYVAPTSSTTAMLALGDALALCVARRRNFSDHDFAKRHPGGALGGLLRPVTDILRFRVGKNLPLIDDSLTVREALDRAAAANGRRPGAILLIDPQSGSLSGIFTDGDLRRLVRRDVGQLDQRIAEVMTRSPRTLHEGALVRDAVLLVREFRQDEIPVVDTHGRPVGVLDVQDLITLKLVSD